MVWKSNGVSKVFSTTGNGSTDFMPLPTSTSPTSNSLSTALNPFSTTFLSLSACLSVSLYLAVFCLSLFRTFSLTFSLCVSLCLSLTVSVSVSFHLLPLREGSIDWSKEVVKLFEIWMEER